MSRNPWTQKLVDDETETGNLTAALDPCSFVKAETSTAARAKERHEGAARRSGER
jgi:hypothetical protein